MPEIQTQTPLEYEPVCDFCYDRCESGGNSCEPIIPIGFIFTLLIISVFIYFIISKKDALQEEPRCSDDCNNHIVLVIKIKMAQRTLEKCVTSETITNGWKTKCVFHGKTEVEYFCKDCFDECA